MHINDSMRTARGASNPIGPGGLVNACLRGVSVAEAEQILAKVWQRIEEHGAETPNLRFDFGRDGQIDIGFSFPNPTIAALILGDLTSSGFPGLQKETARTGHERNGYREMAGLGGHRCGPPDWS
ncbi:hypothetical protein [Azospirillum doebereinerae]|uniref:Uncharacterized protein n=1 Tax=Azospirillum doebereinerae TaxID=92933 RepID=A0A3S0XNA4_9PROT|nr:hypothetical protein [Azospirillum doebereinerae]MCG5238782.1 hypothetical protein [Azospirillum doebereinerae]RUQ72094.1 hypothetical protein EJ913_11055 [Azospirillum doebereinerae]